MVVDGTPTTDRQKWLEAACEFGAARFSDACNSDDVQHLRIQKLWSAYRTEVIDGRPPNKLHLWDVLQARARLRLNTAPGPDGVVPEMWHALHWMGVLVIWQLFASRAEFKGSSESTAWTIMDFSGLPKVRSPVSFNDLRRIATSSVFQQWYLHCFRPKWRKQMRPSHLQLYGFRKRKRTDDVISLFRQLVYLSDRWGLDLYISSQDVQTAFDCMDRNTLAECLVRRGVCPGLIAVILQELKGLKATMHIPGAGKCRPFDFQHGGRQGGVETPDVFNAMMEDALDEVVRSWNSCRFGFFLDGFGVVNHAIFADNIFLFAASRGQLQSMIVDVTEALQTRGFRCKPSSLQAMVVAEESIQSAFVANHGQEVLRYEIVKEMRVLGALVTANASTRVAQEHRFAVGDALFHKHHAVLTGPGTLSDTLTAWSSAPASAAIFASESWHLCREVLHFTRRWEVAHVRQILKLRRRPDEGQAAFNQRTAHSIYGWFRKCGVMMMHHRVLQSVFRSAWRERMVVFTDGAAPLDWARRFRDVPYWLVCTVLPRERRAAEHVTQRRQGHRIAWEDVFVSVWGPDWRSIRDTCADCRAWSERCLPFTQQICQLWDLPLPPTPPLKKPTSDASGTSDGSLPVTNNVPSNLDIVQADALEVGFASGLVPKMHANDERWQTRFQRVAVIVDCRSLAEICGGRSPLEDDAYAHAFRRIVSNLAGLLAKCYMPRQDTADFVEWRPREYNSVPDYLCNVAMDSCRDIEHTFAEKLQRALDIGSCLQLYSDGGFRSGTTAATGWALFECKPDSVVCLAFGATKLHSCHSSFQAEVLALDHAAAKLAELIT